MHSSKWVVAAMTACLLGGMGCGSDSGSGTESEASLEGPVITYFGLTRADDQLIEPAGTSGGVPIFRRSLNAVGGASGFSIVVEAKPGSSGAFVGASTYEPDLNGLPDLQIQVSRPLGDGSDAVCDDPRDAPGGVPGIGRASFADTERNIAVMNDLGCRFLDGGGNPVARMSGQDSCVAFPSGDFGFVRTDSTVQFCGFVNVPLAFPKGDTRVSVRVRDEAGNVGPLAQIIVRVE